MVKGDRFIIRQPSPSLTIGGGIVIDPHPRRHRRFRSDVIESLEVLAAGTATEIVLQAMGSNPIELRALGRAVELPDAEIREAVDELITDGSVLMLRRANGDGPLTPTTILMRSDAFEALIRQLRSSLATFHQRNPLRRGMAKEEIRSRSGIAARPFEELIARAALTGELSVDGDIVKLPEHEIRFSDEQRQRIDRYLAALRASPYTHRHHPTSASSLIWRSHWPRSVKSCASMRTSSLRAIRSPTSSSKCWRSSRETNASRSHSFATTSAVAASMPRRFSNTWMTGM